ncbi:hypothetical protein PR202_ga21611 [Eleusine coracana subsp. coracana]|uniref:Uncharacterized protein n=1 Tax=Eleusine coracana subsp. coracana TaxID=191504 RepID=A0AAV5CZK4_ELECO|nr:hypothetical protein PR202_ga21611 [Eleusine coracana subsp. coracana]
MAHGGRRLRRVGDSCPIALDAAAARLKRVDCNDVSGSGTRCGQLQAELGARVHRCRDPGRVRLRPPRRLLPSDSRHRSGKKRTI